MAARKLACDGMDDPSFSDETTLFVIAVYARATSAGCDLRHRRGFASPASAAGLIRLPALSKELSCLKHPFVKLLGAVKGYLGTSLAQEDALRHGWEAQHRLLAAA